MPICYRCPEGPCAEPNGCLHFKEESPAEIERKRGLCPIDFTDPCIHFGTECEADCPMCQGAPEIGE